MKQAVGWVWADSSSLKRLERPVEAMGLPRAPEPRFKADITTRIITPLLASPPLSTMPGSVSP